MDDDDLEEEEDLVEDPVISADVPLNEPKTIRVATPKPSLKQEPNGDHKVTIQTIAIAKVMHLLLIFITKY